MEKSLPWGLRDESGAGNFPKANEYVECAVGNRPRGYLMRSGRGSAVLTYLGYTKSYCAYLH